METVVRGLYSLAWLLARPLLRHHKRLKVGWEQRLVPTNWAEASDIWVQSASGGESYLSRQLTAALAERATTRLSVLATTCTRQGMEILQAGGADQKPDSPVSVLPRYFPLDQPAIMERAMAMAKPKVLVLLETELWPGLLMAARRGGVPILVLNGRLTHKSFEGYQRIANFWRSLAPDRILAVSQADADRFAQIFGRKRVGLMPNMKFDALGEDIKVSVPAWRTLSDAPLIVLGSVRKQEEDSLFPVLAALVQARPDAALAVAPRHMERVGAWMAGLSKAGLQVQLRSQAPDAFPDPGGVTLWDRFGELRSLYRAADAVFVGGTLAPVGGQNFLEPMACGLVPCVGPWRDNFAWADGLEEAGLLHPVETAEDLVDCLQRLAGRKDDREAVTTAFRSWLVPRQGGSAMAADLVMETLGQAS